MANDRSGRTSPYQDVTTTKHGSNLIVTIHRDCAQFYTVASTRNRPVHGASTLVQVRELKNSYWERLQQAQKLDTRRGSYPSAGGSPASTQAGQVAVGGTFAARSSFSDADQAEEEHAYRLFTKELCYDLTNLVENVRPEKVIFVCGPKLLGGLRASLPKSLLQNIEVIEVQLNPGHWKPHELHDFLANKGLIPKRNIEPPVRPAGQNLAS